jgi:hypothetical protein
MLLLPMLIGRNGSGSVENDTAIAEKKYPVSNGKNAESSVSKKRDLTSNNPLVWCPHE